MEINSIEISEKIVSRFPNVAMGYLVAENMVNESNENLDSLISSRLSSLAGLESVEQVEGVIKWRNIFSLMNAKKGKLSSIESLLSMYIENKKLPDINPIVNYYNSLSCLLGLPMGAYTIDNLPDGEITLREARKNEEFIPIGGKLIEKTSNGEVVYSSGATIICRSWNNKDADLSKITLESKKILFIFDGADEIQKEKIEEGIKILQDELPSHFSAVIKSFGILSAVQNKILIES